MRPCWLRLIATSRTRPRPVATPKFRIGRWAANGLISIESWRTLQHSLSGMSRSRLRSDFCRLQTRPFSQPCCRFRKRCRAPGISSLAFSSCVSKLSKGRDRYGTPYARSTVCLRNVGSSAFRFHTALLVFDRCSSSRRRKSSATASHLFFHLCQVVPGSLKLVRCTFMNLVPCLTPVVIDTKVLAKLFVSRLLTHQDGLCVRLAAC